MFDKIELVVDAQATLGEGPCWDSKTQQLYWVDIFERKLFVYDSHSGENRQIQLNKLVGAVVPKEAGGLILAMEDGFFSMNVETERIQLINDPESHLPENRFNDGKCDPAGRFWAGTTDRNLKMNENGALYCLNTDLSVVKKRTRVNISNGLTWSPDHKHMYYIDTLTKKVIRFDYDISTGQIKDPIDIIFFRNGDGLPDGMTSDEEGKLWIAHWGGSKVSRWDPSTGEQISKIYVPAKNVTSCVFGGKDLNELYITTARSRTSEQDLAIYPHAGGLFKVVTDVKGSGTYRFGG
ncbi:SMP-30/gluconolactonase/LRE family protein [Cytobacillus sp. Hm23]